jgi:hypothetical protein
MHTLGFSIDTVLAYAASMAELAINPELMKYRLTNVNPIVQGCRAA